MENTNTVSLRDRRLKTLFRTLKNLRLPWVWIIAGLALNFWLNSVMLEIPDLTADLTSGKITGPAVISAVMYYVIWGVLTVLATAGQVQAETYGVMRARSTVWKKMLATKSDYFDRNNPQDVMSTVTNDTNSAVFDFINLFVRLLPDLYYIYGAIKRISEYHYVLAVSCFALIPLKYIYSFVFGRLMQNGNAKVYEKIGTLTGYLADRLAHLPLIKNHTNEKREREGGEDTSKKLYKAQMKLTVLDNCMLGASSLLDVFQKIAVVVVAVILLQQGKIDMAMWLAFFLFSQNLFMYIDGIFDSWVRFKGIHGTFERVIDLMESENESHGNTPFTDGDITFKNVTFTYPESDIPALNNVSFNVPKGTSCAIVGVCGSGKTTAVTLLERLYSPQSGTITVGNTDIKDFSLEEFRRHIAYVQQGSSAFGGTIREALTYGTSRDIDDEELLSTAKITGLSDFLSTCPDGLDTEIAPGGTSLSGGQMQRIALTREVLRGGDIIIMDEPTSALDARVSAKIQQLSDRIFANKTRILITHDLTFAKKYDKIVVLKNGVKVGEGTHENLLKECEMYKQMIENNCEEATV